MSDYQQHLLAVIESAQRAGLSEQEIVRLVEEHTGVLSPDGETADEHRLMQRLRGRIRVPKAA